MDHRTVAVLADAVTVMQLVVAPGIGTEFDSQ
jgi:hypothetical protein